MTTPEPRPVRALGSQRPRVHPSAWVAPTAMVVGDVEIGSGSSVWYSAVVRADMESIQIGSRTNVQDGCALHSDPGSPLRVGDGVSTGHNVVLHGCTVAKVRREMAEQAIADNRANADISAELARRHADELEQ